MSEEQYKPEVYTYSFKIDVLTSLNDISLKAKALNFLGVTTAEDSVTLYNIESVDIKKQPYLFYMFEIRKEEIKMSYSVIPDQSQTERKLKVTKVLLDILVFFKEDLKIENPPFFSFLSSAIQDFLSSIPQNYETLFGKYDSLLENYKTLSKSLTTLELTNKDLSLKVTELLKLKNELEARLKKLETLSDETLILKIQEWLETHNNTIDIGEFAKIYKVPEARVEEILNKMISMGYIQPA